RNRSRTRARAGDAHALPRCARIRAGPGAYPRGHEVRVWLPRREADAHRRGAHTRLVALLGRGALQAGRHATVVRQAIRARLRHEERLEQGAAGAGAAGGRRRGDTDALPRVLREARRDAAVMRYVATLHVRTKPEVRDPQGEAALGALRSLGLDVSKVRTGKEIVVTFDARDEAAAEEAIRTMGNELLAKPVLGSCNGFQILCEAGLLPGALLRNASLEYRCDWIHIRVESDRTPWTAGLARQVLRMPIGHGEGCYVADADTIAELEANGQVVFRYTDERGAATLDANPNGSTANIAGVSNAEGNVVGLMPHPERCVEALL